MLGKNAIISLLLGFAYAQRPEDLKVTEYRNVTLLEDEYCKYGDSTFRSSVEVAAPVCKTLTCLHKEGKVRISECAPLRPGCKRDPEPLSYFPECCRTRCAPRRRPCFVPGRYYFVPHGYWFYVRFRPCIYAICNDGAFVTRRCRRPPVWR